MRGRYHRYVPSLPSPPLFLLLDPVLALFQGLAFQVFEARSLVRQKDTQHWVTWIQQLKQAVVFTKITVWYRNSLGHCLIFVLMSEGGKPVMTRLESDRTTALCLCWSTSIQNRTELKPALSHGQDLRLRGENLSTSMY